MPTFYRIRTQGTDLENSHSVYPTFTTANASVLATGHALGDTGDFSNTLYPGALLAPMFMANGASGTVTPFLESDEVLASMNALFNGNYLGETTLLSYAREHGVNVASIGKIGPTAIQQIDQVTWDHDTFAPTDAYIVDDATGTQRGVPLPLGFADTLNAADLPPATPSRNNGYPDGSVYSNATAGDAVTSGTKAANFNQMRWETDVTTRVLLPRFAASEKPFLLLFWSRDPDGTQHNQGDGFNPNSARYNLQPGINGETSTKALHNADASLKRILDWLDANPEIKANTDIILTSDHGFATISRRDMDNHGKLSDSPAKTPENELTVKAVAEVPGTLPPGFLAMDLALFTNSRLFDASAAAVTGDSVFPEVLFRDKSPRPHPSTGNALIGMPDGKPVRKLDGSDAQMVVATNGGSDLIYVPTGDPAIVQRAIALLSDFDYVSGIFVDDKYCPSADSCPGALRLSDIGLLGSTKLPRPAIVVNFKVFYAGPSLQDAIQISDTTLQQGQGMHGGFGRESTWNNMAAIGPDFRTRYVDPTPVGNIDIAPTIAHILGLELPAVGTLRGRIMNEALASTTNTPSAPASSAPLVSAPAKNGRRTVVEFQDFDGHRYLDRGCMVDSKSKNTCAPKL
jgi:arylsulfatase A-like enzyme